MDLCKPHHCKMLTAVVVKWNMFYMLEMSVAVQWQRSASKATSPFGQKHHLVNNDDTRDRAKEDPLKRRSAPSGGVSANEFQTNLPSRPQLPPILNQRQRSPLRYASLHKVGLLGINQSITSVHIHEITG